MLIVAVAPFAILPIVQMFAAYAPEESSETYDTPDGKTSSTSTPVASDGPSFVTVMV